MKKKDFIFIIGVILFFIPFFVFDSVSGFYTEFNHTHGIIMSFVKFAVLATLGEVIGLRISFGVYNRKGFGIIPKMIVWGFLGILIHFAFIIFASGTPNVLKDLGLNLSSKNVGIELLKAFSISTFINVIFAPVMMTVHKISDEHIKMTGGTLKCFFSKVKISDIFVNLNWKVMWNFVFKKTIPYFWIPAHTITFMLAPQYRVLMAAVLGIVLGIILAFAASKPDEKLKN
jgi:hypothetical protein